MLMFNPFTPVPDGKPRGWKFLINGVPMEVYSIVGTNSKVGEVGYGWNGRFDQPYFKQNPGRLVIYVCNHPTYGLLMGGANEPRQLANGSMFSPPGGYDPSLEESKLQKILQLEDGAEKTAALDKYGLEQAAREVLEETGLAVSDLQFAGRSVSNRSIYIVDLKDTVTWTGEHHYVCVINPELIATDMTIALPKDKLGDVMPAPEWSSIQKLVFKPYVECLETEDGVAVTAFSKAYRWWILNNPV